MAIYTQADCVCKMSQHVPLHCLNGEQANARHFVNQSN